MRELTILLDFSEPLQVFLKGHKHAAQIIYLHCCDLDAVHHDLNLAGFSSSFPERLGDLMHAVFGGGDRTVRDDVELLRNVSSDHLENAGIERDEFRRFWQVYDKDSTMYQPMLELLQKDAWARR